MSIKSESNGSGKFGAISPGWSVNEYATPVISGERAGGVGSVSFTAESDDDSVFVPGEDVATTFDEFVVDGETNVESLAGKVNSISVNGINASISHSTALSVYDAEFDIPVVNAVSPTSVLDLVNQVVGVDKLCQIDSGYFYSLRGHSSGFNAAGDIAKPKNWRFDVARISNTANWLETYSGQSGNISGYDFRSDLKSDLNPNGNDEVYAAKIIGDFFSNDVSDTSGRIFFKLKNLKPFDWMNSQVSNVTFTIDAGESIIQSVQYDEGFSKIDVKIDFDLSTITTLVSCIAGGIKQEYTDTVSFASLPANDEFSKVEYGVFIEWIRPLAVIGPHAIRTVMCPATDYSNTVESLVEYTAKRPPFGKWTVDAVNKVFDEVTGTYIDGQPQCGVRALYRKDDNGGIDVPPEPKTVDKNIVRNPGFSVNTANWSLVNSPDVTIARTNDSPAMSGYALKVRTSKTTNRNYRVEQKITSGFDTGKQYAVAIRERTNGTSTNMKSGVKLVIEQYNSRNVLLDSKSSNKPNALQATDPDDVAYILGFNFVVLPTTAYIKLAVTNAYVDKYGVTASNPLWIDSAIISPVYTNSDTIKKTYFDGNTVSTSAYQFSFDADGISLMQIPLISYGSYNREYENSYSFEDITEFVSSGSFPYLVNPAIAQYSKNAWEYIQDFCAAYNVEVALVNGIVTVRNVGSNIIDITDKTIPSLQVASSFAGRNVEIVYNNASQAVNVELYNARDDGNKVISVKSGDIQTTTIETNFYPQIINQPTYSQTPVSGVGEYKIISSDTSTSPNISETLWRDYGGKLEVRINADKPNAIDVILTGPVQDIPAYTSPYKLAYTSGNEYAALSVTGSGIKAEEKTLKLQTGADPTAVKQDVAKTVRNPFLTTTGQAYDAGVMVSTLASGPTSSVSFAIPTSNISGFGLTAGSLFKYKDCIYRINDANISGASTSINASRYTRVADLNAQWAGGTVGNYGEVWAEHKTSDTTVRPLWFVGDDEPLPLLFDTDGNPYFAFRGDSEFGIFTDTDGQYYFVSGATDGDVLVYLDTDFKPYAKV